MIKRLAAIWMLVRQDARLLWHALRHPDAPRWLKVGTAMLVLYLVSPIDLIPDALPIVGVVDDLVIIPSVIRAMLKRLPAHVRAAAQARVSGGRSTP